MVMEQRDWDLMTTEAQEGMLRNGHKMFCAKRGIGPDTDADNGCNCGGTDVVVESLKKLWYVRITGKTTFELKVLARTKELAKKAIEEGGGYLEDQGDNIDVLEFHSVLEIPITSMPEEFTQDEVEAMIREED